MEARVAKLEASVAHIEKDIGEIKADIREVRSEIRGLRYWVLGTGVALTGLILGVLNYQMTWMIKYMEALIKAAK